MALELVPTATMTVQLSSDMFVVPNGLKGTRIIAEVEDVTVEGDRLQARLAGKAAADWLTSSADGSYGDLDVRMTLKTSDDVLLYCTYGGRIDLGSGRIVSTPLFQTGDDRYDWMARSQFLMEGRREEGGVLIYDVYEVKLI